MGNLVTEKSVGNLLKGNPEGNVDLTLVPVKPMREVCGGECGTYTEDVGDVAAALVELLHVILLHQHPDVQQHVADAGAVAKQQVHLHRASIGTALRSAQHTGQTRTSYTNMGWMSVDVTVQWSNPTDNTHMGWVSVDVTVQWSNPTDNTHMGWVSVDVTVQ